MVKADSFFNFFDPPPMKTKDEVDEDDDVSIFSFISNFVIFVLLYWNVSVEES